MTTLTALPREAAGAVAAARRAVGGGYTEDAWGYSPQFAQDVAPLLDVLYDRWWRVRASGLQHVPARGGALIAANHAGVLPWDAAMLATAIRRHHGAARHPRFLVLDWAFELPWASVAIRRFGGVPAAPRDALRLLGEGHIVMVFPEGAKGTGKPWSERYHVERFGRGGFVELALRAGVPIVPAAVVGSEEIYPMIARAPAGLARLVGAPYLPITPTFPLLGPFGAIPLPSRWRITFAPALDLSRHGPDAAQDRALVLDLNEQVRATIQQQLEATLVHRRGAFL
jgi:1-acyl-sn-glycerol-3-phosphate acyltransferase